VSAATTTPTIAVVSIGKNSAHLKPHKGDQTMSTPETNEDRKVPPAPIQLSPEQVKQIAAGTAGVLPAALLKPPIICGGIPAGPVLEGYSTQ
jgi:hypothetical protein